MYIVYIDTYAVTIIYDPAVAEQADTVLQMKDGSWL